MDIKPESLDIRTLAEALHRALVILDDYLCETFGFSRKAKGKYKEGTR